MPGSARSALPAGRFEIAEKNRLRAHREELQRVQIGLVGLAVVLLVVTLANLVIQTARPDGAVDAAGVVAVQTGAGSAGANAASSAVGTNEPLADLGVTPTSDTANPGAVPDLQPDPRLAKPMDRDPGQAGGGQ